MKKEKEKQEKTVENIEEHTHEHNHDHAHENIKVAFFLNLIFAVIETIGGFLTNSVSIFSDAVHDLGDSISIGISYLFEKKSKKIPNSEYTYGYLRYSLLGAFVTSVVLLVGSVAVLFNAIPRLWNPQEINHDAMIIFAIFGLLINGYAAYKTSKGQKTNEKAINLHMLEDVFGWVIVLIGSICIKVFNQPIIDPILSIFLSLYVLFHVYKYFKDIEDVEIVHDYFDEIQICPESETAFYKNAIQVRNRCMVDSADLIICLIEKNTGGAYSTIKYAQKMNKDIVYINKTLD